MEEENAKKTRIMQKSYLNLVTISKYFEFMLNRGFMVKCNPETGCYKVTEKGKNLLRRLKELDELMMAITVPLIFIPEMYIC